MKLYFFPVAPNPTRVRLYLAEKQLHASEQGVPASAHPAIEEVLVNLAAGEQKAPEHLARNPLGKLPVLELADGRFITESLAIIEYIEALHPEPAFRGASPEARAAALELDRIVDAGVLGPIATIVHFTNSPLGMPPNPAVAESGRAALAQPLALVDSKLGEARYLGGERPGVADCTLQAALQFARFREIEVIEGQANVARWDADFRARESSKRILIA